jgi:putative ABC transport system permease protein
MPGPFSIALRNLAFRPLRSALTVTAIMLGTAVVAAAFATNAALEARMRVAALHQLGNADLVVEAADEEGFPLAVVDRVRALPDVSVVAPQLRRRVFFRTPTARGFAEVVGVDPGTHSQLYPYQLVSGMPLSSGEEATALVARASARRLSLSPGANLELMTAEGLQPFRVVGLFDDAEAGSISDTALVHIPLSRALTAFGGVRSVGSMSIKLHDAEGVGRVQEVLKGLMPSIYLIRESEVVSAGLLDSIRELQGALVLFGLVALMLGGYLAFNTLSLTRAEHMQEFGLLRAVGANGATVLRMSLFQGLVLGLAGALGGAAIGQAMSAGLVAWLGNTQGTTATGFVISWEGLALSILLGIGISVVSSLIPTVQAGRGVPIAVLQGRAPTAFASPPVWSIAAGLVAITAFLVLGPGDSATMRLAKAVALLVLFPLTILATQRVIPLATGPLLAAYRRREQAVSLIAEMNLTRTQGQAGASVAAFITSLSLIVALINGTASFNTAGQQWSRSLFPGEFLVVSPVAQPVEILEELRALPGADLVAPVALFAGVWQGRQLTLAGVDPEHYLPAFEFVRGERVEAFTALRRGPSVLVPRRLADEAGWRLGDEISLRSGNREAAFTVAGLLAHSFPTPDHHDAIVITRRDAAGVFGVDHFRFVSIQTTPGTDRNQFKQTLAATAELFGMQSSHTEDLTAAVGRAVGGLLGLLSGLASVGMIIGCLSVITTMLLAIVQRRREIGILRATGMTRRQVQRVFLVEGLMLGLGGAVSAVLLGALVTWVLVNLSKTAQFEPHYVFSTPVALGVIALGTAIATLASFYPAGVAARANLVDALKR